MKYGIHVSKENYDGIHEAIKHTCDFYNNDKYKLNAVQIFTYGPKTLTRNNYNVDNVKEIVKTYNLNLYIHSSYITNIWKNKTEHCESFQKQIDACIEIGAVGIVLHIFKTPAEDIVKSIKKFANDKCIIYLEMKAMAPHKNSYESPDKINNLIDILKKNNITHKQVQICLDTAHIKAGEIDIVSYIKGVEYMEGLNRNSEYIGLLHLNGNEAKGHGDIHAVPLSDSDTIWHNMSYKDTGCRAFVEWFSKQNKDIILETKPKHDKCLIKKLFDAF